MHNQNYPSSHNPTQTININPISTERHIQSRSPPASPPHYKSTDTNPYLSSTNSSSIYSSNQHTIDTQNQLHAQDKAIANADQFELTKYLDQVRTQNSEEYQQLHMDSQSNPYQYEFQSAQYSTHRQPQAS